MENKDTLIEAMIDGDTLIFPCPHCSEMTTVKINEINCAIFRHAVRKNGEQINPHASKEECQQLLTSQTIYGCAKPFRIHQTNGVYTVSVCDYI